MIRQPSEVYRPRIPPKYARFVDEPEWMRKGLVLHLPMQENAGSNTYDSSRYGNDGALTGGKWVENGIEFNGSSDYIDCGNDASLNITEEITISVLVKTKGSSSRVTPGVISKRTDGFGLIWMNQAEDTVYARIYQSDGTPINTDYFPISQNVFHNIVLKADNSDNKVRIYLDSVEQGTAKPYDGTIKTGTSDLLVGKQSVDYFNGSISDVRIYNRALSAAEIEAMYYRSYHTYNPMRGRSVCASPTFVRRNPTMAGGMI